MATVETISIALPHEMVAIVRQAVDTGEYASSSEVVRNALRDVLFRRNFRMNIEQNHPSASISVYTRLLQDGPWSIPPL